MLLEGRGIMTVFENKSEGLLKESGWMLSAYTPLKTEADTEVTSDQGNSLRPTPISKMCKQAACSNEGCPTRP